MSYYDIDKQTVLAADASPFGVSAVSGQRRHDSDQCNIAYGSRPAEKNYSQLERDALAIVFGAEHFTLFLLGHQFELETDHKPFEVIFGNPSLTPPARVQHWMLRLQSILLQ